MNTGFRTMGHQQGANVSARPGFEPGRGPRRWRRKPAVAVGAGVALVAAVTVAAVLLVAGGGVRPSGHTLPGHALGEGAGQHRSGAGVRGARAGGQRVRGRHRSEAMGPPGGPASEPTANGSRSGVMNGVLFGGDIPLAAHEGQLGRRLAIVRVYERLGETFPTPQAKRLMEGGSTLLVSLDTVPGQASYASIAAGHEDGFIRGFLRAMNQAAVRYRLGAIYICFEHEANTPGHHQGLGTPAEFIRAWDHVHQLAQSLRLDWNQGGRLHWVFILTHMAYIKGWVNSYWPGSREVDIVGVDGYNTGGCRITGSSYGRIPPVPPADLFNGALRWADTHGGLPVFVAEWGSVAYPNPAVRVGFIRQMQSYVESNHEIGAAMYWDSSVPGCNFSLNASPSSFAALSSMAHSAALAGRIMPAR